MLIGEQVTLTITVSNPGTGVATGVVLEERIPPGLQHPAGSELEYEVGDLKPGESRKLELPLVANRPGPTTNVLSARGDGNLRAERPARPRSARPAVGRRSWKGRRRATWSARPRYQVSVTNPGTAPAKQVELVATLPPGLKFVSANNAGHYDEVDADRPLAAGRIARQRNRQRRTGDACRSRPASTRSSSAARPKRA